VIGNKIARVNENTHAVTEFDLPTGNSQPFWITSAADKTLWFTELNQGKLGQITTDGTITETDVPAGPSALLTSIVQGRKRTLWFTEADTDKVGKLVLAK
jgi:virginiamycin B lyase